MSATTTQATEAATTPRWLPPALSFASSLYLHVILSMIVVAATATVAMGLAPHIISTGSMDPAIKPGDLVLTSVPETPGMLAQGEVITYRHPKQPDELVTHRIVEVLPSGGYRTQGDANRAVDTYVVEPGQVVGVGRLVVPMIGLPATWLRHGLWLEFGLFVLASVLAFAGATIRLDEDDEDEAATLPGPDHRERSKPLHRRATAWAAGQVAAVGALATIVLAAALVVLDGRTTGLVTDRVVAAAEVGAAGSPGGWRLAAVLLLAVTGYCFVRVALSGGGWESLRARLGLPRPVTSGLTWVERDGALFVAVLAAFVMTGAGTALAQTTAGAFNDAVDSGATMTADEVAPPTGLVATAGCDGFSPTVDLSWTASTTGDADGYEVRRGPTSDDETLLGSVLGLLTTSYEDTAVDNGTTYFYEVSTTLGTWTSDPAGNAAASVTTPDCSPPEMWVQSLDGSASGSLASWTASATVTVVGDDGPVDGATVTGDWSGLLSLLGETCTTGTDGTCTFTTGTLLTDGSVTLTVTDVSHDGHEYVEPTEDPSVTINAPES